AETFEWALGSSATHQPNSSSAMLLRDVRAHGGLTSTDWLTSLWRYSIGLGFDAWAGRPAPDHADDLHTLEQLTASIPNHARTLSLSTEIERRSPDDRLTVLAAFSTSFPLTGTPPFQSLTTVVSGKSSSSLRGWQSVANVGVTEVSARAPLSVWPKPAVGSELSPFLRAHPLLDRGVVALNGTTVFGRELLHGTVEARYWKLGRAFLPLGLATFLDFARARNGLGTTSGLVGPSSHPWEADAGAGVRLKLLGSSRLIRLDFGYGLRDRARAVTFGPTF
ncbi:MAG TPA: hypothetical protein VNZ26_19375, partial [Vicinamibacterales bacterium]|nr:hypothetical protein [Vicinamibacterales bacterium]